MAERFRLLTKTDYSVSTTGNLGPDVLEGKNLGLIYVAVSKEGRTISKELTLRGNRDQNKIDASIAALTILMNMVDTEK